MSLLNHMLMEIHFTGELIVQLAHSKMKDLFYG